MERTRLEELKCEFEYIRGTCWDKPCRTCLLNLGRDGTLKKRQECCMRNVLYKEITKEEEDACWISIR